MAFWASKQMRNCMCMCVYILMFINFSFAYNSSFSLKFSCLEHVSFSVLKLPGALFGFDIHHEALSCFLLFCAVAFTWQFLILVYIFMLMSGPWAHAQPPLPYIRIIDGCVCVYICISLYMSVYEQITRIHMYAYVYSSTLQYISYMNTTTHWLCEYSSRYMYTTLLRKFDQKV